MTNNPFGPKNSALDSLLKALNSNKSTKRKAFFSFDYDDIMRVNNVRQAWKIDHPDNALMRSFYDSSLWESRKAEGDAAVKQLIRDGVQYTSAICILIGTNTWSSRWVRYEIARAIVDARGLLAVHINGLNHHVRRLPDALGLNPLDFLAVGKRQNGALYLYEKRWMTVNLLPQHGVRWHPASFFSLPSECESRGRSQRASTRFIRTRHLMQIGLISKQTVISRVMLSERGGN